MVDPCKQTPSRRLMVMRVSRSLLADLFKQDPRRQVVVVEGLPEDARLVGLSEQAYFDTDQIALKFESDRWPEVPHGQRIPEVAMVARTVDLVGVLRDALDGRVS